LKIICRVDQREYQIEILDDHHINLDGEQFEVDLDCIGFHPIYSLLLNGKSYEGCVDSCEMNCQVFINSRVYSIEVADERSLNLYRITSSQLKEQMVYDLHAPMPGLVVSVKVEEGQDIQEGDVLIILESMKMQNEIYSPRSGKVKHLQVKIGDQVSQRAVMLSIE
jgi:biotin carboxyl carrier protein